MLHKIGFYFLLKKKFHHIGFQCIIQCITDNGIQFKKNYDYAVLLSQSLIYICSVKSVCPVLQPDVKEEIKKLTFDPLLQFSMFRPSFCFCNGRTVKPSVLTINKCLQHNLLLFFRYVPRRLINNE